MFMAGELIPPGENEKGAKEGGRIITLSVFLIYIHSGSKGLV